MNRRGCVLIVDDDEDWCEELTEILQREGFQVDSAPTIAKALELLDDAIYHLLVVDIRMNEDQRRRHQFAERTRFAWLKRSNQGDHALSVWHKGEDAYSLQKIPGGRFSFQRRIQKTNVS